MLHSENCDFVQKKSLKFQLYNIIQQFCFLNLGMFPSLSTYEINHKIGYTHIDDMLKFSRKSKTGIMLSRNFECYNSKF